MKKIISLLLIFWMSINYAQYQRNLVIVSGNNEPVQVFVNERLVNPTGLNEIRVTGLTDNYYNLRVQFLHRPRISVSKRLYLPPMSEIVYEVYPPERRGSEGEFLIANIYPVAGQEQTYYPPQQVFSFGNLFSNLPGQPASGQVTQAGQINININNNSSAVNQAGGATPVIYVPDYHGEIGCTPPVTQDRYQSMLDAVEKQSFEDSKLRVAKQIIKRNNCMTVNQLVGILRLFSFDSSKLTLAKYAYHYVYDIENYYKVNNVFNFESNVRELDEYIQNQD